MRNDEISEIVVEYLLSLPKDTEITNAEAIKKCCPDEPLEIDDFWELDVKIRKLALEKGINLDPLPSDTVGGLMFYVPYCVKRRRRQVKRT